MTEKGGAEKGPRMFETFQPGYRAAYMAQVILNEIGQESPFPPVMAFPSEMAKWQQSASWDHHYQLLKFNLGVSGRRYHFSVIPEDGSPSERYMIHHYANGAKISQLDDSGKEIELTKADRQTMQAHVLSLLTHNIPKQANKILDAFVNDEFNALIGRLLISQFAVPENGQAPRIGTDRALLAAEQQRQLYKSMIELYGDSDQFDDVDDEDSEDDGLTVSLETAATKAAVSINHKWPNTFNPNLRPEQRIQRSS